MAYWFGDMSPRRSQNLVIFKYQDQNDSTGKVERERYAHCVLLIPWHSALKNCPTRPDCNLFIY